MPEDMRDNAAGNARQGRERRAWQRFFLPADEDNHCCALGRDGRRACVRFCDIGIGGARIILADGAAAAATPAPGWAVRFEACSLGKWGKYLNGMEAVIRWSHDREAGCLFLGVRGENND